MQTLKGFNITLILIKPFQGFQIYDSLRPQVLPVANQIQAFQA